MAFTTWDDLKSDLKDLIADHIASGKAITGMVTLRGNQIQYNSIDDVLEVLAKIDAIKSLETTGDPATRVSYGSHKRR